MEATLQSVLLKARKRTKAEVYTDAHEKALAERLKAFLKEWARKISKRARNVAGLTKMTGAEQAVLDKIVESLSIKGFSVDLLDEISPDLLAAFTAAGATVAAEIPIGPDGAGVSTDQMDAAAEAYVKEHGAELVKEIEDTTRDRMKEMIGEAVREGYSADELADNIEESGVFGEARAETIARTELATAHVQGNIAGWEATGLVDRKQWITGAGCCPECQELDGVIVDMDEDFDYADGPVEAPPAHPNCRCDILPLLVEDSPEAETQDSTE